MKNLSLFNARTFAIAATCAMAMAPFATHAGFQDDAISSLQYYDDLLQTWTDFSEVEEDYEFTGPIGIRAWIPDYDGCSGSGTYTLSFDLAGPNVNGLGPAEPVLTVPGGAPGYVTWQFNPDNYFDQPQEIWNLVLKCRAGGSGANFINGETRFVMVGHNIGALVPWLLRVLGWVT
jgi:hypothetical protein